MIPVAARRLCLPLAIGVVLVLVLIYFAAALAVSVTRGVAGVFDWVMNASERIINRLELWGERL